MKSGPKSRAANSHSRFTKPDELESKMQVDRLDWCLDGLERFSRFRGLESLVGLDGLERVDG